MLELLDDGDAQALVRGFDEAERRAEAGRGAGDRRLVTRVEGEVAADPRRAIRFDAGGFATVSAAGRRFRGGRFEVASIGSLKARAAAARERAGRPKAGRRLWEVAGPSVATDIGALQASALPGSLFQVASQFNCLEAQAPEVVPVAQYLHDPTQGPRASISALPGTLVRHYAAPDGEGGRFVQVQDGRQVELLRAVCAPGVARVENGYLRRAFIDDPAAFARRLDERFDDVCVGVHEGVEVVFGADWLGRVEAAPHRTIAQVFTSTIAGGMYGGVDDDPTGAAIIRSLQRAAYLGTLLAAAALGMRRVCLTLIGGGVFANPGPLIWDAILWASDQIEGYPHDELSIVVNSRSSGEQPMAEIAADTRARGGGLIRVGPGGASVADG